MRRVKRRRKNIVDKQTVERNNKILKRHSMKKQDKKDAERYLYLNVVPNSRHLFILLRKNKLLTGSTIHIKWRSSQACVGPSKVDPGSFQYR